ncbi:hypothetical protein PMAYCL1PPCAC_26491, partial [Pristionchus mayeri]
SSSSILEIASSAREIVLFLRQDSHFSDPASFVVRLVSLATISVRLEYRNFSSNSFIGLPHSFWKKFFDENLSSGVLEFVDLEYMNVGVDNFRYVIMQRREMKAPVDLKDKPIRSLEWKKAE